MKVQNLYFVIWSPSKQAQCRFNAGPPPTTPAQHQINTRPMRLLSNSPHRHHNKTRYTSTQRRYNADPAPQTVGQHCTITGRTLRACRGDHKPHTYKSSHHPQEVLLAQFSLYVHKGGLKPDSFHFIHTKGTCMLAIRTPCFEPKHGLMLALRLWCWPTFSVASNMTR